MAAHRTAQWDDQPELARAQPASVVTFPRERLVQDFTSR